MIEDLRPLFGKFANFAKNKMGFDYPPKLFLKSDLENSKSCFGNTAHYDPAEKAITIFTTGRHPKDILRSFAHELVHHTQNLRGDLSPDKCGQMGDRYAQENDHMRKMEQEAYLVGNMCFRDWEDNEKFNLQESKILKENKTMTNKITKESLKEMIRSILEEKMKNKGITEEEEIEEQSKTDTPDRVAGRDSGGRRLDEEEGCPVCDKEGCEGCAVEEATTHQDVVDAADAAVDATNKAAAKERSKKAAAKKAPKDPGAKYDDDLFDAPASEDDEIADVKETSLNGTPERENNLYESRFSKRNTNLFEDLVKKWTK